MLGNNLHLAVWQFAIHVGAMMKVNAYCASGRIIYVRPTLRLRVGHRGKQRACKAFGVEEDKVGGAILAILAH